MRYWMIALPRADMEHCIKIGTFGLARKYVLGRVGVGDKIGCYVTKEYKVIALGEVTAPYYLDDKSVFKGSQLFPDRIDFSAKRINPELDFMSVIDQMSFIKNMAYWTVYFRNGIVEISGRDWKAIEQACADLARR